MSLTGARSRPGATGRCLLPEEKQHPPQAGVQDRRKGGGCAGGGAGPPVGTHLADMLCEAVPRARRPSTHKPKHSVTSGEFQSWSTGCGTRAPPSRTRVRPGPGQAQAGPGTGQGAHLGTTRGAVLHPLQVYGAEGRQGEAREPLVIVLVHTQREGGVRVSIARGPHRPQGGRNALVAQPGLQLGRAAHIIDDALRKEGGWQVDGVTGAPGSSSNEPRPPGGQAWEPGIGTAWTMPGRRVYCAVPDPEQGAPGA